MQAVGMSIAKPVSDGTFILITTQIPFHQEIYIRDINSEFEKLEPPESVESDEVATATLHKVWFDVQKVKRKNGKPLKSQETRDAFEKYYQQGEPRNSSH